MSTMWLYLVVFVAALLLALALNPVMRRIALRTGFVAPTTTRSVHREPKPYLGGLAIYLGFALTLLAGRLVSHTPVFLDRGLTGILVCGALTVALGAWDDRSNLPARWKMLGSIAIAALLVWGFDVYIGYLRNPFASSVEGWDLNGGLIPWGKLLTVFWIISFMHGVNLIDGLDGLCAGVTSIAALTLMIIAYHMQQWPIVLITAALAGASIGFLRDNFNPAKIFMGDAGALFLGFTLAAVSVHGVMKSAAAVGVAVPVLAVGLPIFDTVFAIFRRVANGRPAFQPDKDHLHHRLLRMGLSHRNTVLVMWGISAWLGVSAVVVANLDLTQALLLVVLVGTALVAGAVSLRALQVRNNHQTRDM